MLPGSTVLATAFSERSIDPKNSGSTSRSYGSRATQSAVSEVLKALRNSVQKLIEVVTALSSFKTLPLQRVRCSISQIPLLRAECVHLIQQLESFFRTPKRFYQSRSAYSTAAVNDFVADLEKMFAEEWSASAKNKV